MEVMEMMAMGEGGELEFSGCSSTTSIDDEIGYAMNNWSPVMDWGTLGGDEDFQGLMESMMCEEDVSELVCMSQEKSSMPSSTTTSSPGTPVMAEDGDETKGLRLVHLLMAAAEALSGASNSRELARVILVRLKELVSPATDAAGSNMERLAAHFTDALQSLLDGSYTTATRHQHHHHHHTPGDMLAAFQLLQDMSPYVKFGHFTANQAILEAVSGDRRVHIIDYDIMEGIQWASLMQALVSRTNGPPAPHLRITAVARTGSGSGGGGGRKGISTVQETGRRLAAFASSIGQPFSFAQCRLDGDEGFRPSAVRLMKGEVVIINCMLHLPHSPHRPSSSVSSFLSAAASLNPKIITLVEEEEEDSGGSFLGRFMEALHRYSAVCDAMEVGYPKQGRARELVERVFLGPRIIGAVGRAYNKGKVEGEGRWGENMAAMGFGRVGISCFNHCQARLLLGLFNDGYTVQEDAPNKLVLGWKSRRLLSASVWSPPAVENDVWVAAEQQVDSDFLF